MLPSCHGRKGHATLLSRPQGPCYPLVTAARAYAALLSRPQGPMLPSCHGREGHATRLSHPKTGADRWGLPIYQLLKQFPDRFHTKSRIPIS